MTKNLNKIQKTSNFFFVKPSLSPWARAMKAFSVEHKRKVASHQKREEKRQLQIHRCTNTHCLTWRRECEKQKLNLVHLEHPALHWGRFKSLQAGVDVDKSWALLLADNAPLFQFQNWIQNIIGTGIASLTGFFIWHVWSAEMFGL